MSQKKYQAGGFSPVVMRGLSLASRLDAQSIPEPNSGCTLWLGGMGVEGYGKLQFRRRVLVAHRAAWEVAHGPVPDGMFVCHRCDNPSCINTTHLFLGTAAANMRDKILKGRHAWGSRSNVAKLDEAAIREILADGRGLTRIAAAHGVCRQQIWRIKIGRAWPHIARQEVPQ